MKNWFIIIVLGLFSFKATSQTHKVIFGITPNLASEPKVINPSPAHIWSRNRTNVGAELLYNYIPKSNNGILVGLNAGIWNWSYRIQAPRKAFGTHIDNGSLDVASYSPDFIYTALVFGLTRDGSLAKVRYHLELGSSLRLFPFEGEPEGAGAAFNRATPYDDTDPNAGPPDLLIEFPMPATRVHPNFFADISFPFNISGNSELMVGVVKNWNLKPVGKGTLFVQYDDTFYNGEFSPRSSFIGLNVKYGYQFKKSYSQVPVHSGKYRSAVFVEASGNGMALSGNLDIRLKPDRNGGWGFRGGAGYGNFFYMLDDSTKFDRRYMTIPLSLNYIIGERRSGLEAGLGVTQLIATHKPKVSPDAYKLAGFFNFGYRLQPINNGIMFRVTWTPEFNIKGVHIFNDGLLNAGASVGYSFK